MRDPARSVDVRIGAAIGVIHRLTELDRPMFELLKSSVGPAAPPLRRLAAAEALSRATMNLDQLGVLTTVVRTAGRSNCPGFSQSSKKPAGPPPPGSF
jgi:hypothetical protein